MCGIVGIVGFEGSTQFARWDTATGEVLGKTAARHTSEQFVGFLAEVIASQPEQRDAALSRARCGTAHRPGRSPGRCGRSG